MVQRLEKEQALYPVDADKNVLSPIFVAEYSPRQGSCNNLCNTGYTDYHRLKANKAVLVLIIRVIRIAFSGFKVFHCFLQPF